MVHLIVAEGDLIGSIRRPDWAERANRIEPIVEVVGRIGVPAPSRSSTGSGDSARSCRAERVPFRVGAGIRHCICVTSWSVPSEVEGGGMTRVSENGIPWVLVTLSSWRVADRAQLVQLFGRDLTAAIRETQGEAPRTTRRPRATAAEPRRAETPPPTPEYVSHLYTTCASRARASSADAANGMTTRAAARSEALRRRKPDADLVGLPLLRP